MNGGTPKTGVAEFWGGPHQWVTPAEMGKRTSPYIQTTERTLTNAGIASSSARPIPPNSIILSSRAPIGHLVINTVPMSFNQGCKGLIPKQGLNHKFLYYYLVANVDLLNSLGTGATFKELAGGKLKEVRLPLPPLEEQKRIVAILDEAFEGIAKATANAERNLANARELPDALLDATLASRDGAWVEATLGEIAEFKNGLNFTKASKGETIRIVGVKDFRNEYWVPSEGLDTVTIDGRLATSYELRTDDILTVRSNGNKQLIGRCMIAAEVPEKTSHSGFTIRIRVSDDRVAPQFLAHVLKSRSARADLVASGGGANISSLNQQALAALPVAFPSRGDQERILTHIESLMSIATQLAEACRLKLGSLVELKQALLHKAFSGQLTGKEAVAA